MIEDLVVKPRAVERHKIEKKEWGYPYQYDRVRPGAVLCCTVLYCTVLYRWRAGGVGWVRGRVCGRQCRAGSGVSCWGCDIAGAWLEGRP